VARGKICSICGERVLSCYAERDDDGLWRCPVCRRVDRPFARAVAYGSYDSGLRELVHLLEYNGVRPATKVLGRMLADAMVALERVPLKLLASRCFSWMMFTPRALP